MAQRISDTGRLSRIAYDLRCDVIDMVYRAGSGHPGGSLSAAEIVATLYWAVLNVDPANPAWPGRDRVVLSKGHACPVLYAALARRGFFSLKHLVTLRQLGSILQGHPDCRKTPGVDMTTGSLGQGLSLGLGMALGARHTGVAYQTYVILSDGEMEEGMTWEAAMAAGHYHVANLVAVVDMNALQVDGFVTDVMGIEPLADKWRAFGWNVLTVNDGHAPEELSVAFEAQRELVREGKPVVILCHTLKGKGVSYMENVMEWHASPITAAERHRALGELAPHAEAWATWQPEEKPL